MDFTQVITLSPLLLVAILTSILKPLLERFVAPSDPAHDSAVRLLAIGVGLVTQLGDYLLKGSHLTGPGFEQAAGNGLVAGIGAVIAYHLVTGSFFDSAPAATITLRNADTAVAVRAPALPFSPIANDPLKKES